MANRVFIVIGLLAIIVLGAAFVVPHFVQWNEYKPRLEAMASNALGKDVTIQGNVKFVLLPQPQMFLEDVLVGELNGAFAQAKSVQADFSLIDFLRDRFTITKLLLDQPIVSFYVDEHGALNAPINIVSDAGYSSVSINNADLLRGQIEVVDRRSDAVFTLENISGALKLESVQGPFSLQGTALVHGEQAEFRLATSKLEQTGVALLSGMVRSADALRSLDFDGKLITGEHPNFSGKLLARQKPIVRKDGQGDLLIESQMDVTPQAMRWTDIVVLPDENLGATRLTGSGDLRFGANSKFDIRLSAGVLNAQAKPLSADVRQDQYDILAILRDLPVISDPQLDGKIEFSANEVNLRGTPLRNVDLTVIANNRRWSIANGVGDISGDTQIAVSGDYGNDGDLPNFAGRITVKSNHPEVLAGLWRRNPEIGFTRRESLEFDTEVYVSSGQLELKHGVLSYGGSAHRIDVSLGFSQDSFINITADLAHVSPQAADFVQSILPDYSANTIFKNSFPKGRLDVSALDGFWAGHQFDDVKLTSRWEGERYIVEGAQIQNYGGIAFEGAAHVQSVTSGPKLELDGHFGVVKGASLLRDVGADNEILSSLIYSMRENGAEFDLTLADTTGKDGQTIEFKGLIGEVSIFGDVIAATDFAPKQQGRLHVKATASAERGSAISDLYALEPIFAADAPVVVEISGEGEIGNSFDVQLMGAGADESIKFDGRILSATAPLKGQGKFEFALNESGALMDEIGAFGVIIPKSSGRFDIEFSGREAYQLTDIKANIAGANALGNIKVSVKENSTTGVMHFDEIEADMVGRFVGGVASGLRLDAGLLPDGPIDIGQVNRTMLGGLDISTDRLRLNDTQSLTNAKFTLAWGANDMRIKTFSSEGFGGVVQGELVICCTAQLEDLTSNARITLQDVDISEVLPSTQVTEIIGKITLALQGNSYGRSYDEFMRNASGEGSYNIHNLIVESFSPNVFSSLVALGAGTDLDAETLKSEAQKALRIGAFKAHDFGGVFAITSGTMRLSNMVMNDGVGRMIGNGTVRLHDGNVNSTFILGLAQPLNEGDLAEDLSGRIGVRISGDVFNPLIDIDVSELAETMQMKIMEREVARLEALQAQDNERRRIAAEEQARRIADEQARLNEIKVKADAALLAAEQEALAASEAARRLAEEAIAEQKRLQSLTQVPVEPNPANMDTIFNQMVEERLIERVN